MTIKSAWVRVAALAFLFTVPQRGARAAEPPQATPVGEQGFHLKLPGLWSKVAVPPKKGFPVIYRSAGGREQVSVSVLDLTKALPGAQRHDLVKMLVAHRQGSERRSGGAEVTFAEIASKVGAGAESAQYLGTRTHKPQRFATLIVASAKGAWTFFYESYEDSEAVFAKRAAAIMSSATVDE